ncbi:MAG: membrane dipeptidase [Chloroflexota bacterium]
MKPLIVDAHIDFAYNMLSCNRDYTRTVNETRLLEKDTIIREHNDDTVISYEDFQKGRITIIFSTLFAAPKRPKTPDWEKLVYSNSGQAYELYSQQLDTYQRLFDQHGDKFCPIQNRNQLDSHLKNWRSNSGLNYPTGFVILMEGADCIRSLDDLSEFWDRGVRIIGPAWKSTRFCGGTGEPGPLTRDGKDLLKSMASIGYICDLSHMAWESAAETLDIFEGTVIASHANAIKQVKNGSINRFLTDEIIHGVIERNGVIGVVPYNKFLDEHWKLPSPRSDIPLSMVADQIDYICQIAGCSDHVSFGSDFDGGFGLQQIPYELDTIADLQLLNPILSSRGYSDTDISKIFGENWIRILDRNLP